MLGHKYYCPSCGGILDLIQEESDDATPDVTYNFECRSCSKRSRPFSEAELNALGELDALDVSGEQPEKAKDALKALMGL
jgi:predicted nucleic acid-binding Zn ribbon protein